LYIKRYQKIRTTKLLSFDFQILIQKFPAFFTQNPGVAKTNRLVALLRFLTKASRKSLSSGKRIFS